MDQKSYQASLKGAAYFIHKEAGLIRISGPSRKEFLQRQTTGDVNMLSSKTGLLTVLTSPTAKIIDVLYLMPPLSEQDDSIDLITLPGRALETERFLKSRIFFNDNVSLTNLSDAFVQIDLTGAEAGQIIKNLFGEITLKENEVSQTRINHTPIHIINWKIGTGLGIRLIFSKNEEDTIFSLLDQGQAVELAEDVFEIRRIEEGLPWTGKELTDAYTPLETNLKEAVSENKGCYTGQEVIARQINYDKVTRQLAGLVMDDLVSTGAEIRVKGRAAGTITSSGLSPRFGPVALGIIKRPFYVPGTHVLVLDHGKEIEASVSSIPFRT
jgi:tRNA-modifying protein YgfZ